MMRDTPRTFVGPVVLFLRGPVCRHVDEAIQTELGRLPGISHCHLDVEAGTLVVAARAPIDRTDIVAVLDRLGCPVQT